MNGRLLWPDRRVLAEWLLPALLLYVAAAFLLPKGGGSAVVFYLCVLPCLLARLASPPAPAWRDAGVALAVALIVWSGLTLFWGEGGAHRVWQFAADSVATLGFVLALVLVLDTPRARAWLALVLIWAGCANALVAISRGLVLPPHDPHDPRLWGWGVAEHPILGAMVMTTAYLTALARGLARPAAWWNFAAAAVMLVFIVWCESRGPLAAAWVATLLLLARHARRWWPAALLAAVATAADLALTPQGARIWGVLGRRGASHRLEIWSDTLGVIAQRPWFGHGLGAQMHLPIGGQDITFPHDLYLSLLYYSGVAGLALFAALAVVLAARLWRGWDSEAPWLAAMGVAVLTGGLTDLGQVTKGPGPMWLILWVPVGLMLSWWRTRALR